MSFFIFLTVVQTIVAAGLVGVILMQRSEGGGLGIGGSPGGLMGARGAADFLTRTTRWLAILFVVLSITLAAVAVKTTGSSEISTTLDRTTAPSPADLLGGTTGAPAGDPAPGSEPASDPASDPASERTKERPGGK